MESTLQQSYLPYRIRCPVRLFIYIYQWWNSVLVDHSFLSSTSISYSSSILRTRPTFLTNLQSSDQDCYPTSPETTSPI